MATKGEMEFWSAESALGYALRTIGENYYQLEPYMSDEEKEEFLRYDAILKRIIRKASIIQRVAPGKE